MASKRQRPNGTWEFKIKNKLLDKDLYFTFDDEGEGDAYCAGIEAWLKRGELPPSLENGASAFKPKLLQDVILAYQKAVDVPDSDVRILNVIINRHGQIKLGKIDEEWAEVWIADMKRRLNLSPSTIRHHVGALNRCFRWAGKKKVIELVINPLGNLDKNYSSYSKTDRRMVESVGGTIKTNTKRSRRVEPHEEEMIRHILDQPEYHQPGKQRPVKLKYRIALRCLFLLALESAMRMREMFTLTLEQVDIERATIFLKRTKNGDERQVPLTTVAIQLLKDYVKDVGEGHESMMGWAFESGKLFPWWSGDPSASQLDEAELVRTSMRISRQFRLIFDMAECPDLHFHDTRHEATSRIFERTDLDYLEIAKITGHKDPRMLMVYANLRGSHLAAKLWSLFVFASVAACAFEISNQTFSYIAWV